MGRACIEAVLALSARQVAGPPQQGKARQGDIVWHGAQPGRVRMKERQLQESRPRLRRKDCGGNKEVPIPAYEAMQQEKRGAAAQGQQLLGHSQVGLTANLYGHVVPGASDAIVQTLWILILFSAAP